MTNTKFRTRIIYIVIIVALLIPLFLIGRPSSVQKGEEGQIKLGGGLLAKIRQDEDIVDVQLGEIDPGGSTMKLATFGMRGVALALLWNKSIEYEKKFDWNNVVVTSNQITMLEPRFIPVWDFLGWRLAYNASANQDDYRERYRWVIRGFEFLEEGTHYNAKAPFLYHKAGWTISQKIGIADEKEPYRQLFREDDDFHIVHNTPSMADRDNWLFGIPWYKKSEELFLTVEDAFLDRKAEGLMNDNQVKDFYEDKKRSIGNQSRPIFLANSRRNLIHFAEWYELDGNFGEKAQYNWRTAELAWRDFGDLRITTTIDDRRNPGEKRVIALKDAALLQKDIDELNEELLELLKPLTKKDLYIDRWNGMTEDEQATLVGRLERPNEESYIAIREYLDETRPGWQAELTEIRDALITDPEELSAFRIPEPIRKGARGMEQSDERDEINMAQKASRAVDDVVGQIAGTLALTPQAIAVEIATRERLQREAYQKYLAELEENPGLKDDPDFPVVEPPTTGKAQKAREIEQEIDDVKYHHQLASTFAELTNYVHFSQETFVEQTSEAISANEAKFIARRAFNKEGNVYLANEKYLESMRIWSRLMENPLYDFLNDELFRRDFMEFIDRYRHVTNKLDDAERGNLYPEDFPFEHVVLKEFEYSWPSTLHDALVYLHDRYQDGDFEDVADRSRLLINAWHSFMEGYEYLYHVPVRQYRDETVEVFALYVDSLLKTGREYDRDTPLIGFINDVMYYDPMTREAIRKTEAIDTNADPETLLSQLTDAAFDWNIVIMQFPVLKLSPESYVDLDKRNATLHLRQCHDNQIVKIIDLYVGTCRTLNRPMTTEFPLHYMLPEGVVVTAPDATPATEPESTSSDGTAENETPVTPPETETQPEEPQAEEIPAPAVEGENVEQETGETPEN